MSRHITVTDVSEHDTPAQGTPVRIVAIFIRPISVRATTASRAVINAHWCGR